MKSAVKSGGDEVSRIDYSNPPLKKLNLRANHLKGNIILGNFTVSLKLLFLLMFFSVLLINYSLF